VQRQLEPREALAQLGEEAFGFRPMLEAQDEVIRETHDDDRAARLSLSPSLGPQVEDIVEVDVGQHRTDAAASHGADLTLYPSPILQYTGAQPFPDEPHDASVCDAVLDKPAPSSAIDLPLKLLVWEDPDGGTQLSYNDPRYLQDRHHLPPELVQNLGIAGALAEQAAH